jgi:hypothetical protein
VVFSKRKGPSAANKKLTTKTGRTQIQITLNKSTADYTDKRGADSLKQ